MRRPISGPKRSASGARGGIRELADRPEAQHPQIADNLV
jgi:hypothetical protein